MARSYVKDTDKGARDLLRNLKVAGGQTVRVGLVGTRARELHGDSDITVEELGLMHELGVGVPRRSWLRSWCDRNRGRVLTDMRRATIACTKRGARPPIIALRMGQAWATSMADDIRAGKATGPALLPETVRRKGHDRLLDDTGQLADAITAVLVRGSGRAD